MSIIFYDHLVDKTEIIVYIETLDAPVEEKASIRSRIDEILHHGILELILQKLHPHHHHTFLDALKRAPYDPQLIGYLKDHAAEDIEDSISHHAKKLISEILSDLKSQ